MKSKYAGILLVAAGLMLAACGDHEAKPTGRSDDAPAAHRVDLVARGMQFQAPDEIPAGWTTFRFQNASTMTHFAVIERLPEGIDVETYKEAGRVYQRAMNLINAGQQQAGMQELGELPKWTGKLVAMGGPGLTAPGHSSQETVYMEPGRYMIECYVKTDGVYHSTSLPSHPPMIHELTVTASDGPTTPPEADARVIVSEKSGIRLEGAPAAGEQTFAVYFQAQSHNLLGADVHLFRVRDDADIQRADEWMNALSPHGMETPAPIEFLGGTEELPTGKTAYFTITLRPGRYALISEVPDPAHRGLLATFTVPSPPTAED